MRAGLRSRRLSAAGALLSLLALVATTGCGDDCDHWRKGTEPVCDNVTGGANITAPAQYALPAIVSVVDGHSCIDAAGGCSDYPIVHLANTIGRGQYGIELTLRLPFTEGAATYTFPTAWTVNYFNLNAELNGIDSSGMPSGQNLEWVAGTINVEASSAAELRLTFDLELQLPSGEAFSVTSGAVTVNDCYVKETLFCVKAGDG
jgi:hypothetical protein